MRLALLLLCLPAAAAAFEARRLAPAQRVVVTVGAAPPRDAFSSVHGVSLSFRDELAGADAFDAPVAAAGLVPTGRNTSVYVLDSGCGSEGVSFVPTESPRDTNGHGSHVASLVRRLAPDSRLVCAKVFDRNLVGTAGRTMQALAWSAADCACLLYTSDAADD